MFSKFCNSVWLVLWDYMLLDEVGSQSVGGYFANTNSTHNSPSNGCGGRAKFLLVCNAILAQLKARWD